MKDENFNDKQMQEENKNREIMHRIKESAEKREDSGELKSGQSG